MSKHPLTPPLVVPPPPKGLGSNSNYALSSQCNPILGLVVTVDVTDDIVLDLPVSENTDDIKGFSFQLNCWSPPGFTDTWQQYVFALHTPVSHNPGSPELKAAVQDFDANKNIWYGIYDLMGMSGSAIPAGYQLQIRLINDNQNNIVGANWIVNDLCFPPAPTTPLTGYTVQYPPAGEEGDSDSEQNISYIGTDGHIHYRFREPQGNWIHNDLSVLTGSSIFPGANSALDAYVDEDWGHHVNFIGTDGHVHELYLASGGHWIDYDLTQLAQLSGDSVPPMSGSRVDGYVDREHGQHVNFIGADGHVHELFTKPHAQWIDNDLTQLALQSGPSVPPRPNSPLDGYLDDDDAQHVNFIGTDGHVHELYIHPHKHWINNDLIVLSGSGMTPSRTSPLCGYMAQDNSQHVNFIDPDGHVRELYKYPSAQWQNNDLTQLAAQHVGASVPAAAPNSALCGYYEYYLGGGMQHVNFISMDGHVHDLAIAPHGQWTPSDLTQLAGTSATPAPNGALSSYGTTQNEFFVNFIDVNDGHLHQFALVAPAQCTDVDLNNIPLVNFVKSPIGLPASEIAPINAFEFDLIGPGNGANAVFSSGAGTFTYAASTPLTVNNRFPSCVSAPNAQTAETSNGVYGTLDAGPSVVITQIFSIDPTGHIIHFQGPVSKGLKLPLKRGEPLKQPVPHRA